MREDIIVLSVKHPCCTPPTPTYNFFLTFENHRSVSEYLIFIPCCSLKLLAGLCLNHCIIPIRVLLFYQVF